MLVAVVGMRVEILKLSSRTGLQVQQAAALESSNAILRSTVTQLSGNQRIELLAQRLGMVMPGPMDVHFVSATSGNHVLAAIKNIRSPAPSTFLRGLASERAADGLSVIAAVGHSAVGILATSTVSTGPVGSQTSAAAGTTAASPASSPSATAASGASTAPVSPSASAGSVSAASGSQVGGASSSGAVQGSGAATSSGSSVNGAGSVQAAAGTTAAASASGPGPGNQTTSAPVNASPSGVAGSSAAQVAGSTTGGTSLGG
ncbi:MAG: hypothetical protein ACP5H2_00195 [Solirubrobacteraceae bacterium]